MKPHLVTVVGAHVAQLSQMLDHYRDLGVESIFLYVHLQSPTDILREEVEEVARARGLRVSGHHTGDWLELQYRLIAATKERYRNDWFLIADQDEFQLYPTGLPSLLNELDKDGIDHIEGCFIDRFAEDGSLRRFDVSKSIWEQYPIGAAFTFPILKGDPRKVVAAKGYVRMTNSGHHATLGGSPCPIERCLVQVHHFKWIEGLIGYLQGRHSERWPDVGAVGNETHRFIKYFFENNERVDLSDGRIMAALCDPYYPHWDRMKEFLRAVKRHR